MVRQVTTCRWRDAQQDYWHYQTGLLEDALALAQLGNIVHIYALGHWWAVEPLPL